MFELVEMIEIENEEDEETRVVAEKVDLTYYPKDYPEGEEEYLEGEGEGDGDEEEEEEDNEEGDGDNGDGNNKGGGDNQEKEEDVNVSVDVSGEKVGEKVPVVALVPVAVEKTTPKKQPIPVQFNTLTRSARKRQEEELIRDVQRKQEEDRKREMALKGAPIKSAPITKEAEGALVKGSSEVMSSK